MRPRPKHSPGRRSAMPRSMCSSSRPRAGASGCLSPISNRQSSRTRCSTSSPILTRETKRDTLLQIAAELGVPLSATVAVGDGANDLPMLEAAGLGIAFHAKPAVAAAARWRLDHADLTGILYAQGYRQEEIIEP